MLPEMMLVARREFRAFFASAAAWLFLAAWLVTTLFVFFWVEAFFARNLADVRPLFTWLPRLMIILVAALTMRSWSEERRGGTIESLLTSPVRPASLVLGKFLAVIGLVAVALALTVPIPLVVSRLGALDWGPVAGGYLAALLLAAAYAAVGLWSSARTDNPIVALLLTTLVCGLLWAVGAPTVTNLFGNAVGGVLAQLGTGRRFESILRGVLDLRDLAYFGSIVGVFLALNLLQLERLRWAGNPARPAHRRAAWIAWLAAANFVAANLWLAHVPWARLDLTRGRQYSLSSVTRAELRKLREPLLIRGYFSARTHPLLAPLVPQLQDVLREYAVAGGDRVRVQFIDPQGDKAAEEEAASRFGVRPVPFQTADRYQAAVVSSYFDVVVAYGDRHEALGFRDLVEVKVRGPGELDVVLKDPEYLLTGAIRKAVTGYRGGGSPLEALDAPVAFKGFVSRPERLPASLRAFRADLDAVLAELIKEAGDKLTVSFQDPDADGGKLGQELRQRYGFVPQVASLVDPQPFWFYLVLEGKDETVQLGFPEKLERDALRRVFDSGLQRLAPGVLRTIGIVSSTTGAPRGGGHSVLEDALAQGAKVRQVSLDSGRVPEDVDLLLVLAPRALGEPARFGIDQFLMRGGSVVLATSPFDVQLAGGLSASRSASGLEEWLAGQGIQIGESFVLDPQSAALPVPVRRYVGGLAFEEIQLVPYPHFPDLRERGLDRSHPVTASLGQLTVPWASPIELDAGKLGDRRAAKLLVSSDRSWTSASTEVVPDWRAHPGAGFAAPPERGAKVLAVAVEGPFESGFKGKTAPPEVAAAGVPATVIEKSPPTARLVVLASNAFASDAAIDLASQGMQSLYVKPVELVQNVVDWSLEDPALLALRGRSRFAATLVPLSDAARRGWESATYALVLAALGGVFAWRRGVARADRSRHSLVLEEVSP